MRGARPLHGLMLAGTREHSAPARLTEVKAEARGLVREWLWGDPRSVRLSTSRSYGEMGCGAGGRGRTARGKRGTHRREGQRRR